MTSGRPAAFASPPVQQLAMSDPIEEYKVHCCLNAQISGDEGLATALIAGAIASLAKELAEFRKTFSEKLDELSCVIADLQRPVE